MNTFSNTPKRKLSNDLINKSVISPIYTEKPSFSFEITTQPNNSQLIRFRANSSNKYKTRIRKQIDFLSNTFRNEIIPSNKFNRPIARIDKPEYSGFGINYITTIAELKERNKEMKSNNYDVKKKAYDFLFGNSGFGKKKEEKGGLSYYVQNRQNKNRTLYDILKGNK